MSLIFILIHQTTQFTYLHSYLHHTTLIKIFWIIDKMSRQVLCHSLSSLMGIQIKYSLWGINKFEIISLWYARNQRHDCVTRSLSTVWHHCSTSGKSTCYSTSYIRHNKQCNEMLLHNRDYQGVSFQGLWLVGCHESFALIGWIWRQAPPFCMYWLLNLIPNSSLLLMPPLKPSKRLYLITMMRWSQ